MCVRLGTNSSVNKNEILGSVEDTNSKTSMQLVNYFN
jgi:hypothetical protein